MTLDTKALRAAIELTDRMTTGGTYYALNLSRDEIVGLLDAADALAQAQEEARGLREGILEALGWNWLDEDFPQDVYDRLSSLAGKGGGA